VSNAPNIIIIGKECLAGKFDANNSLPGRHMIILPGVAVSHSIYRIRHLFDETGTRPFRYFPTAIYQKEISGQL